MSSESGKNESGSDGKTIKAHYDFEFISSDPQENADNFDPKWARLRELNTDDERYRAIRERWGNSDIPDPKKNLSYCNRNYGRSEDTKKTENNPQETEQKPTNENLPIKTGRQSRSRDVVKNRRRSRSCTRPYEQIISNLERNYHAEYCQLMYKQKVELQEMLQIQSAQKFNLLFSYMHNKTLSQNLEKQQKHEVYNLISSHYEEVKHLVGKKLENIDSCKRYMDEIRAFLTFYQKMNGSEITLQMTDDQYEHTKETERMYSLYSKYYN